MKRWRLSLRSVHHTESILLSGQGNVKLNVEILLKSRGILCNSPKFPGDNLRKTLTILCNRDKILAKSQACLLFTCGSGETPHLGSLSV